MKWFLDLFSSSIGRKVLMALTGIFLILFLIVHLIGNLQLLNQDGGKSFNIYADFMGNNTLVQIISKGNFAFIIIHIVWALLLTIKNRQARGGVGYAKPNKKSTWTSRNMGILGTIILIFLVIHIRHFYAEAHFGSLPMQTYDGKQVQNLYAQVAIWFAKDWYVAIYVACMAALAFHLWHGFTSAFQTLGLNHLKYNGLITVVGRVFSIVVPAGYAWIPISMFFFH